MVVVSVEPADNGVIKYIIDDNINAGGGEHMSRVVYDLENDQDKSALIKFIQDLILDLGIDSGTEADEHMLSVKSDWGDKYKPTIKETKERIKLLEGEIKRLSEYLNYEF